MRSDILLRAAILAKVRRFYRRFEKLAREVRAVQQRVLLEKIHRCRDSRFGRDHDFAGIRTVDDFRERLPVAGYDAFKPYIEDLKRGDVAACFGRGERVLMFAVTSGTYAEPKYIPVTRAFMREYRTGWHVWGAAVARDNVAAWDHRFFRMVSSADESRTDAGIPCGAISGFMTASLPWIVRRRYLPPPGVARVENADARYYLSGRIGVANRVSLLSAANPSSILSVVRAVDVHRESIVRDLYDGTVSSEWDVDDDVKRRLGRSLKPRRKRARELEDIIRRTGRLLPRDYWRDLKLIGNWKGGSCAGYLDRYDEYFGDVPVRDIGLLASEGRMTIPLTDEGASGPLDIGSHFFEFIPEGEINSDRPTVLMAHELEEGRNYFILLTTSSGLYRYNIMDLVQVTGRFEATPEVRFLNKGAYFSSLTGEKLSEFQVVESLSRARAGDGPDVETAVLSPTSGETPAYALSVEREEGHDASAWTAFLAAFERALHAVNVEYAAKRDSGRLGAPVLHLLAAGTFERLRQSRLKSMGGRHEQYKHCFLVGEIDYHKKLPVEATIALPTQAP